MALHGALCLHNFRKRSNHAGLRTYMKVYRYMKKVGLQRYLISFISASPHVFCFLMSGMLSAPITAICGAGGRETKIFAGSDTWPSGIDILL